MVSTLFQHCNAVLRWKSLLRIVSCNVALKRRRRGRDNRELTQRRGRRQQERQKSNWFRLAKQQLCTCITLFCTFLCRRCTTTTWKCLISRFVENVKTKQRLASSFRELCSLLGPVYMEWGTPVWWGWFLLFLRSGGHKTKETYPTRPRYPTPCKQGLRIQLHRNLPTFDELNEL